MAYKFRTAPKQPKSLLDSNRNWMVLLKAMNQYVQGPNDNLADGNLLFDAIKKGKFHLSRFILEASQESLTNTMDIKGRTPLMVACSIQEQMRRTTMVQLLLDHGADVNVRDDHGRCVLSHACESKCNDVVDLLMKHKSVDPDASDIKGNTPLIFCSMVGNDVGTDLLTRHFRRLGLRVDHANKDGFTALLMAAKHGNISCAKILLHQGMASLLHRDRIKGYSAQDWLQVKGYSLDDIAPTENSSKSRTRFVRALSIAKLIIPRERLKEVIKMEEERAKYATVQKIADSHKESRFKPCHHEKRKEKISRQIADMLDVSDREHFLINSKPHVISPQTILSKDLQTERLSRSTMNSIVVLPPINICSKDANPYCCANFCHSNTGNKKSGNLFVNVDHHVDGNVSNDDDNEDSLTDIDVVGNCDDRCYSSDSNEDENTDIENVF